MPGGGERGEREKGRRGLGGGGVDDITGVARTRVGEGRGREWQLEPEEPWGELVIFSPEKTLGMGAAWPASNTEADA